MFGSARPGFTSASTVVPADEAGLRPAQVAEPPGPPDLVAFQPHLPEEVVRREEGEVAAQVAVPLSEIEAAPRLILVVPVEDDEVVQLRELLAVHVGVEVLVR